MKRAASLSRTLTPELTKKIRTSSPVHDATVVFADPTQLVYVTDLRNCTEASGYIQGRVNMKWPHSKKQHILLDTLESALGNKRVKVDVYFQAKCGEILEERDAHIEVGDEIALSLQGVMIEDKSHKGPTTSFKLTLRYSRGAVFKFVTRRNSASCGTVNTWVAPSVPENSSSQDWFDAPQTHHDTLDQNRSLLAKIPVIAPMNEDDTSPAPSPQHDIGPILIKSEPREPIVEDDPEPRTDNHTIPPSAKPNPSIQSTLAEEPPGPTMVAVHHTEPFPPLPLPLPLPLPPPPPVQANGIDPPPKLSKRQEKRLKDKEKRKISRAEYVRLKKASLTEGERMQPPPSEIEKHRDSPKPAKTIEPRQPDPKLVPVVEPVTAPMRPRSPLGPLALKPGRKTRFMTFASLSEARNLCTVAGVVVSASTPNTTNSGDFHCTLCIVDPSICKIEDNTYRDPLRCSTKVNCFSKSHIDCLPCPQLGDVVILKDVKSSDWNGKMNLVGYNERLQWTIYSQDRREIYLGDGAEAQKSDLQRKGAISMPFHEVRDGEIQYCEDLIGWWHAIEEEQKRFNSSIIHLGGEEAQNDPQPLVKTPRPHWLIKDIQPNGFSNGYFDATLEVVYCFKPNLGNYYILFVTDYTSNEGLEPFKNAGVHASLSTSVARLECWDQARLIATAINIGDYIAIRNVRCRIDNRGSYELKVQENKIRILREADARHHTALANLLERKKAHQDKHGSNDPSEIEHRHIEGAEDNKFFSSVVEVLYIEPLTPESTKAVLYVTDYTPNPLLHETLLPQPIPTSLGGRVLKLVLCDNQAQVAKQLKDGDTVSLHKMRITKSYANGMSAMLGGDERLVHRLYLGIENHKASIEGLNKNKENWKQWVQKSSIAPPPTGPPDKAQHVPREPPTPTTPKHVIEMCPVDNNELPEPARKPSVHYTPIKEVMEVEACPAKFRVYARIADFFPSVEDWVYRSCKNCKKDIPTKPMKRRACFDCNDVDHEYVEFKYRFWLSFEDEKGSEVIVSVTDDCPMLDGLPRTDLGEDKAAYQAVRDHLIPFGGNVQTYISDKLAGKETKLQSPFLLCILVSCMNSENEKLYSLEECSLPS
ncbi:hypothetical protein E1B28_009103 [Marasmius oreades]|uniref:Protection of telomeres protein 1 n=1 Tax=Marasmius oreades TaxID=181124 RepID=A0A9P7UT21_9AGAR|nr:uncharacterized protein E1B28_009103 [Marasmius oreades]KAG7092780.1 hypothetical protein E1B28_009103 [Marasmius oreades]